MEGAPVEYGVCRLCDGPSQPEHVLCFCCTTLVRQLGMPLAPVAAVAPYRLGDELHRRLRRYKDASVLDERVAHTAWLAALLGQWLGVHGEELRNRFGGAWTTVVTVPSSHRPAGIPMAALVEAVPSLARLHQPLLVRGPGATDHLLASRHGFVVPPGDKAAAAIRRGSRVLVVDDSFTTGARAQSAVAALRRAGILVGGVLVVGRAVAPESAPWQAAYWRATAPIRADAGI